MQPPLSIASLYIDFDAFFANVEKQIEPGIRARPVGITALGSEHAALIPRWCIAKGARIAPKIKLAGCLWGYPKFKIHLPEAEDFF